MGASNHIKRAIAEVTGQSPGSSHVGRQGVLLLVVLGVMMLGIVGWIMGFGNETSNMGAPNTCVFRVAEKGAPTPVTEGDASHINICVKLEKVTNGSRLQLGLSNRTTMAWDRGMLFDFGQPDEYCMWMKDMRFGLDMIWLDEQNEIVAMRENLSPRTFPKSFCGPKTARYVVEVNAGVIKAADLRLSQHLNL